MSQVITPLQEVIVDIDPAQALLSWSDLPMLSLLDSADIREGLGRYAYLMADPVSSLHFDGERVTVDGEEIDADPWDALRQFTSTAMGASDTEGFPFWGGVVGYLGYEMGETLEDLGPPLTEEQPFAAMHLHLYDVVLAWDHHTGRIRLFSTGLPETDPVRRAHRARERLDFFRHRLQRKLTSISGQAGPEATAWTSNFTEESYLKAVQRVRAYIRAGDIFQANLTQRFTCHLPTNFDPIAYYLHLRAVNPAPFAALLRYGDETVASASPEQFLTFAAGRVETRPIKGTRPRSTDPSRDAALAAALLASEKDLAENTMIVDLLRNDLARVCRPGSVQVSQLCGLESYANVHHLVSVVEGHLNHACDRIDLLRACFPGGSITGAPKKRSMEIIRELERLPRQVYCGAIGYFGLDGQMMFNIAIRTVLCRGNQAWFQVGGGITWGSDPVDEYRESLTKAERLFASFQP